MLNKLIIAIYITKYFISVECGQKNFSFSANAVFFNIELLKIRKNYKLNLSQLYHKKN